MILSLLIISIIITGIAIFIYFCFIIFAKVAKVCFETDTIPVGADDFCLKTIVPVGWAHAQSACTSRRPSQ